MIRSIFIVQMAPRWHITAYLLTCWLHFVGSQNSLTYSAQCLASNFNIPCASAQWSEGGPQKLHAEGKAVLLSLNASCSEPEAQERNVYVNDLAIGVTPRGGCSFGFKALSAQLRGVSALVILDHAGVETAVPPGLGPDSHEVVIPVVMAPVSSWIETLMAEHCGTAEGMAETCADDMANLNIAISLELPPQEADLWQKSPWYSPNTSLSADPSSNHYSIVCDPLKASQVSDDPWLLRTWLSEVGASNCHEIGDLQPQFAVNATSIDSTSLSAVLAATEPNGNEALLRLPVNDAVDEPMHDLDLIGAGDAHTLLPGLNSNSHQFPWDGHNKYPRFFQSGVLVLKNACIRKDGIAVTVTGSAQTVDSEFHYGGCGCCPLGHGEIGRTFVDPKENEVPIFQRGKKVISLVQRFHHVFYHFLLEELPRLLQVIDLVLADREWRVLVDVTGGPFVRDYLVDVMGLWESQILPYERGVSVCAALLLVPAPLPCGHAPRALTLALRQKFLKYTIPAPPLLPSYLPIMTVLRRPGVRSVGNQAALVAGLRSAFNGKYAVEELETEALHVVAQMAAFRRTSVLIAPHGSGLSNSIHLPEGSTVVELLPWEYPNLTFYVALAWLPLKHTFFLVPGANAYSEMSVDVLTLTNALVRRLSSDLTKIRAGGSLPIKS